MGDPADWSVYSADTSNGRCEGLDFSSDRIYCPLCPQLLSAASQSTGSVINFLKTSDRHACMRAPIDTHRVVEYFLC